GAGRGVGGTTQATQQILEAAESIDQAASALSKVNSLDQQKILSEEIQERVISIFEACNFQDLTGQRISKVMTTMKFIESHINVMMDIWGGVDAIKAHAAPIVDTREGDAKLLNGPKLDGDAGPAPQDDTDALIDSILDALGHLPAAPSSKRRYAGAMPAFLFALSLRATGSREC